MGWDRPTNNERLVAGSAWSPGRRSRHLAPRRGPCGTPRGGTAWTASSRPSATRAWTPLRTIVELAAPGHAEAQKGGPAAGRVRAAGSRVIGRKAAGRC